MNTVQETSLSESIDELFRSDRKDIKNALSTLFSLYPMEKALPQVFARCKEDLAGFADSIYGSSCLSAEAGPIHTIGIFYYRYYNGGVEKVISHHIPMFLKLGYQVVLITEEIDPSNEYPLPGDVKRVLLPTEAPEEERCSALRAAIEEHGIDLLLYHASSSPIALFDLITAKLLKTKFVFVRHEPTALGFMSHPEQVEKLPFIYRLADKLIVLSRCEEQFYTRFGADAVYIQNPVFPITCSAGHEKKEPMLLWLGRLEKRQKQYDEALAIMKKVIEHHPSVKCVMVGGEQTPGAEREVKRFIAGNRLEGRLLHLPYTPDVASLYEQASVHLLTSRYEMFPMVVAESKARGIPLVAYDLPTLEFFQNPKGMLVVPQHNIQAAADAVTALLENEELRQKTAREARESLEPYLAFDLPGCWHSLIEALAQKQGYPQITKENRRDALMWAEMFAFQNEYVRQLGVMAKCRRLNELLQKTIQSFRRYGLKKTLRKISLYMKHSSKA